MNKITINYGLLLFLYAYLRQLDLSLDRSRWTPWQELKDYYRQQIAPGRVAALLLATAKLTPEYVTGITPIEWTNWRMFIRFIGWKGSALTKDQVLYCYQVLKTFEKYLQQDFHEYNEQEQLRVQVCKISYQVIEYKLSLADVGKASRIEHYLQNENIVTIPLKQFYQGLI
ncbi:hypothetical protein [Chitinophaga pinensis]|uniref:Uncharacterized protein n=1 Tax=Chitinophaga pinensis (strain ATCC 43595 / DSM 2588 / LMG 13176 / NBRC 15968 / NCIMB 11800 / UQM 2034) TaxID=485918 RepID=A0A979FZ43_CHIPD|nr:hypothetical protein [Chitinophaga pinensis]ACU57749.1 hypothetical protein Cpin_0249 [Chitinophaga pinensis DSM 2588]